jgi:hypothetical protein
MTVPPVIDAKENMTTITIGEGTDCAIHLLRYSTLCSFELYAHPLALGNHIQQLVWNPHMPSLYIACHQCSLNTIKHQSLLPSYLRYALLVAVYIS